jgi:uncharacterized protein
MFRIILALLVGLSLQATPSAAKPSFDCAKASTATEFAICRSRELSALDVQLADAFKARRATLSEAQRRSLTSDQRAWLSRRNACGSRTDCLAREMRDRIAALRVSPPVAALRVNLPVAASPATARPSFDCARASHPAEHTICRSSELARLDWALHHAYQAALGRAAASGKVSLRDKQRAWLRSRNTCTTDQNCLAAAMVRRASELELFTVQTSSVGSQRTSRCVDRSNGMWFNWCAFGDNPLGTAALLMAGTAAVKLAPHIIAGSEQYLARVGTWQCSFDCYRYGDRQRTTLRYGGVSGHQAQSAAARDGDAACRRSFGAAAHVPMIFTGLTCEVD